MKFAVFLDIDGVLNTRTTCEHTPDGYTGIDDARVEILAKAIKKYESVDLILSSDWKEMSPDCTYPERLLIIGTNVGRGFVSI